MYYSAPCCDLAENYCIAANPKAKLVIQDEVEMKRL